MSDPFRLDERGIKFDNHAHHTSLLSEVYRAYSEYEPQASTDPLSKTDPCFHFTAHDWFTDGVALRHAYEAMDGCGGFVAEDVTPVTREIGELLDHVRVAVGRHHEPVLFIEASKSFDVANRIDSVAVSTMVIEHDEIGVCRYIADGPTVTPHEACDHNIAPVDANSEAEPEPDSSVVRADF